MKKVFFFCLTISLLSACSYVSQNMRSDEEKMADLEMLVAKVAKAYSWQAFEELVPMIDGMPNEIMRQLTKQYKGTKFNEVTVDQVSFKDGAERAFSVLEIKSFSAPTYVLESHFDQIEWSFNASKDGWKIKKINIGKAKDGDDIPDSPSK